MLDVAFDDYLEEARVANEKGVCYQALKGHRYPVVDMTKLTSFSRECRLNICILLSSYIINGIPEMIFYEAMHAVLGPESASFAEAKELCLLPEFGHTALICLLRRTIMKDYDDYFSEEDPSALRHLRQVSVQPRYVADFKHLRASYALLHGTGGSSSSGLKIVDKKGYRSSLPKLLSYMPKIMTPPSPEEVHLLMTLPDIVTSSFVSLKDDSVVQSIGAESNSVEDSWHKTLAKHSLALLSKSATYQRQMELPTSQTQAEMTYILDPLVRASQDGIVQEDSYHRNERVEVDLRSLSMDTADSPKHEEHTVDASQISSRKLTVSLISNNRGIGSVEGENSLDLSIESPGEVIDEQFSEMKDNDTDDGGSLQGLKLVDQNLASGRARSPSSRACNPFRVSVPATDVAVFTANRLREPKFGLMPLKQTLRSAKYSRKESPC